VTESAQREPTNEALWAQPPVDAPSTYPGQSLAPVTRQSPAPVPTPAVHAKPDKAPFVIAIISLGVSIPLTAIGLAQQGLPGLVIMWLGLVLINVVFGALRRPR
jgi:hypothetical protein